MVSCWGRYFVFNNEQIQISEIENMNDEFGSSKYFELIVGS